MMSVTQMSEERSHVDYVDLCCIHWQCEESAVLLFYF